MVANVINQMADNVEKGHERRVANAPVRVLGMDAVRRFGSTPVRPVTFATRHNDGPRGVL